MNQFLILKIGGSIIDRPLELDKFLDLFLDNLNPSIKYIVLAGGGSKCNQLRERYRTDLITSEKEEEYHWKAVRIMEENARVMKQKLEPFSDRFPIHLTKDISPEKLKIPGIYFIQPYDELYKDDSLEKSWRVTSDSIAIYYAHRLGSPICILIKHKPYLVLNNQRISKISSLKLVQDQNSRLLDAELGKGLIDPLGPLLCGEYKIPILILDGADSAKITDFFSSNLTNINLSMLSSFGIEIYPNQG